jgi:DNA-binding beta-propeller fold protein YncE
MGPITRRAVIVVAASVMAAVAGGCGAAASGRTATRTLPEPFAIVARWTAESLGLDAPAALAIGPDGNLYVTDYSQRVTVIAPEGRVLRRWGERGSGAGEFDFETEDPADPTGLSGKIAVGSNGLVYVSDSGNARVEVFTSAGRFVRQFGSRGTGPGQFAFPFDIAVDGAGNAYVADDQNVGVIEKFSPTGTFLWRIGGTASADPDLNQHHHFDGFDSHGRLVAIGDGNGEVIYLDGGGHKVDTFNARAGAFSALSSNDGPCEVTVDALGNTYVTGCGPGPTLTFDRRHRLVAEYPGSSHPLLRSPSFGPHGEVFGLQYAGSCGCADAVLKLRVILPGG